MLHPLPARERKEDRKSGLLCAMRRVRLVRLHDFLFIADGHPSQQGCVPSIEPLARSWVHARWPRIFSRDASLKLQTLCHFGAVMFLPPQAKGWLTKHSHCWASLTLVHLPAVPRELSFTGSRMPDLCRVRCKRGREGDSEGWFRSLRWRRVKTHPHAITMTTCRQHRVLSLLVDSFCSLLSV